MDREEEIPEEVEDNDCFGCGRNLVLMEGQGCPECKACGGVYTPGTEECDFCTFERICGQ